MKEILILGPGCYRCTKLYEYTEKAVSSLGIEAEIFKVTDPSAIAGFGILSTPAMVVDGEIVSAGKLLNPEQIKKILEEKLK